MIRGDGAVSARQDSPPSAGHKSLTTHRALDMLKVDAPHLGSEDHRPHLEHLASRDAHTFSRLIFRELGTG